MRTFTLTFPRLEKVNCEFDLVVQLQHAPFIYPAVLASTVTVQQHVYDAFITQQLFSKLQIHTNVVFSPDRWRIYT